MHNFFCLGILYFSSDTFGVGNENLSVVEANKSGKLFISVADRLQQLFKKISLILYHHLLLCLLIFKRTDL